VIPDLLHAAWQWASRQGGITGETKVGQRFGAMGPGARIAFPAGDIVGPAHIAIGRDVLIGAHVTLAAGMPTEILATAAPVITIGDRTTVGRGCHLVGRVGIHIAHDVTLAPNVYVTDHNHHYGDVTTPIGIQVLDEAPVSIGPGSWLATNVVVLPGTTIGRQVTVAAGSVVRGEVPDCCVVAGVPAKVVRRWSERDGWDPPLPVERVPPPDWPRGYPSS
jgi:acetyltransferase-like isoleucine patch superfamily enzyme